MYRQCRFLDVLDFLCSLVEYKLSLYPFVSHFQSVRLYIYAEVIKFLFSWQIHLPILPKFCHFQIMLKILLWFTGRTIFCIKAMQIKEFYLNFCWRSKIHQMVPSGNYITRLIKFILYLKHEIEANLPVTSVQYRSITRFNRGIIKSRVIDLFHKMKLGHLSKQKYGV